MYIDGKADLWLLECRGRDAVCTICTDVMSTAHIRGLGKVSRTKHMISQCCDFHMLPVHCSSFQVEDIDHCVVLVYSWIGRTTI